MVVSRTSFPHLLYSRDTMVCFGIPFIAILQTLPLILLLVVYQKTTLWWCL